MATLTYIETCLPCYVQDHRNRDGELLLGAAVDSSTTVGEIRGMLADEFSGIDLDRCAIRDETFRRALDECRALRRDAFEAWDGSLDLPPDVGEYDDHAEYPQAWFLLVWGVEDWPA